MRLNCQYCEEGQVAGTLVADSNYLAAPSVADVEIGVDRRATINRVLLGQHKRADLKALRDLISFQSTTLAERQRLTVIVALKWLRGRRDLILYLDAFVGLTYMGAGAFCASVAVMTHYGRHPFLDAAVECGLFEGCIQCFLDGLADFKDACRLGCIDGPLTQEDIFDWQYMPHMMGRFDHKAFSDDSDMMARLDYEALITPNALTHLRREFEELYEQEISDEGRRFGFLLVQGAKAKGQVVDNCFEALTRIPTGSMPKHGMPQQALEEVDVALLNKKLAIIYMSEGEEHAIKWAEQHAISGWLWKLEVSKLRNLSPGSLGLYLASAKISAYGEARFLATMPNCPLMYGDVAKEKNRTLFMQMAEIGYVADRDYKNYNICHRHDRMRMFYLEAATVCRGLGQPELADELEYCATCLETVGTTREGVINIWEFGLQTGWAHTMLFHCMHNTCGGRAAESVVKKHFGWHRLMAQHQGDDSEEVWSDPLAGPVAQAILDAAGQTGQATKQHFARDPGSWTEFLRERCEGDRRRGSSLRAICSFCSNDSQHSPLEGGYDQLRAIATAANTVWRRSKGALGWRPGDLSALCEYWAASNVDHREKVAVDWRCFFADRKDALRFAAYPDLRWSGYAKIKVEARHKVQIGPTLLQRATRNLVKIGVYGSEAYAREYAKDVLEAAVVRTTRVLNQEVGPPKTLVSESVAALHPHVKYVADAAIRDRNKGMRTQEDADDKAGQLVIGMCFGGSERVAKAFLKDGKRIYKGFSDDVLPRIQRGIAYLAGKTCVAPRCRRSWYPFPEEYWAHLEVNFRRNRMRTRDLDHDALAFYMNQAILRSSRFV